MAVAATDTEAGNMASPTVGRSTPGNWEHSGSGCVMASTTVGNGCPCDCMTGAGVREYMTAGSLNLPVYVPRRVAECHTIRIDVGMANIAL